MAEVKCLRGLFQRLADFKRLYRLFKCLGDFKCLFRVKKGLQDRPFASLELLGTLYIVEAHQHANAGNVSHFAFTDWTGNDDSTSNVVRVG